MAVYYWIYGTATLPGDLGDFRIRMCGEGLRAYTDALTELSRRLLAVDYRAGCGDRLCWFAGDLDRGLYVVAAGGGQSALLGAERPLKGGFREQFGVFACGFDGPVDQAQYKSLIDARDTALFEPLKAYAWELSNGQRPALWSGGREREQRLFRSLPRDRQFNIFPADPERNAALWGTSALRPVALDLLSPMEARKLIDLLPNAAVTVAGEEQPSFYAPSDSASPSLLAARQAKQAAQQVEETTKKPKEGFSQNGRGGARIEPLRFRQEEEKKSVLERMTSKLSEHLNRGPNPAPPKALPSEDAILLRRRWDRVDRMAGVYKAQLDSRQLETVERLLEELHFKDVRALCPADLVRDWCWVRLWLGSREGESERTLNARLAKFIQQVINKALRGRIEVEELISGCEEIIMTASTYERRDGEA